MPSTLNRLIRSAAAASVLMVAATPSSAAAQQRYPVAGDQAIALGGWIFGGQTTAIPGGSFIGGGGFSVGGGGVSLRASGALNRQHLPTGQQRTPWVADLDAMIESRELGRVLGVLSGSFAPIGFVGVGRVGVQDPMGFPTAVTTLSYGGGASFNWFDGLRVTAEARYRTPFASNDGVPPAVPAGMGRGTELRLGLAFGGGSRGSRSASVPRGPAPRTSGAPASATARRVLDSADGYLGVPYRWGGTSPSNGFDCSGFTQYVFAREGIRIPRNSRQQSRAGIQVPNALELARPGDLLFFAFGSDIDHVGIYVGDYRMIHATASGGEVRYDSFSGERGSNFLRHMVEIRRYIDDSGTPLQLSPTLLRELSRFSGIDAGDRAPRER
jgi:cell wall-associated NlpC family hydrolase